MNGVNAHDLKFGLPKFEPDPMPRSKVMDVLKRTNF